MIVLPGMDFQGGDTGGGYTHKSGYGGGGGGSQDSAEKKGNRRSYDEQTLIPVTIQMAQKARSDPSAGDGSVVLEDGRHLHTVKIVGAVREIEGGSTNLTYIIEDGTGSFNVKQWLDDDNESSVALEMRKETAQENIYIKAIGQIKDYEGRKQLVANSVRRLSTGNELTHHLLEVIYSAEKFKRADSIVPPMMMMGRQTNTLGGGLGNSGGVVGAGGDGEDNSIKQQVLAIMQQHDNDSEEGVTIAMCVQMLPGVPEAEIRKAAEMLSEEGCVYSTINETSFKVAV
jgi:replication factor A2